MLCDYNHLIIIFHELYGFGGLKQTMALWLRLHFRIQTVELDVNFHNFMLCHLNIWTTSLLMFCGPNITFHISI